jgi:exonuclease SbcC
MNKLVQYTKKTYENINNDYEKTIKEKAQYDQNQQLLQEISLIKNKIDKRTKTIEQLKQELERYKHADEEVKRLEERINDINNSSIEFLKHKTRQKTALSQLEQQIKEIKQKENSIERLGATALCPTCERQLGMQYQFLLNKYQKKYEELLKNYYTLQTAHETSTDNHERIKRELEALKKKKEYLRIKEKKQEQITLKIDSQKNEKLGEKKELNEKQQLLKKTKKTHFDISKFQILQKKRQTIYDDYQQLIKKREKTKDILSKQALEHEKTFSQLSLLNQKISSSRKQRDELKKSIKKIKNEQKKILELSILKDVMVSFRSNLISRIQPALSEYASIFFHDLTDGKYSEMTLDDYYNIYIYDEGNKYPIQRFSGGEIDLANLCLRLAISNIITERADGLFHFIILDEIFGSQDHLRQQNIMEELSKLSSTYKQIFLITHIEQIKNYMQHIINVTEMNDASYVKIN